MIDLDLIKSRYTVTKDAIDFKGEDGLNESAHGSRTSRASKSRA